MNGAYVTSVTESKYYGVSEFKKANVPATAMQQAGFGALFLLDKNRKGEFFTNKNDYKADQGHNRYHQEEVAGAGYDDRELQKAGVNILNRAMNSPPSSPRDRPKFTTKFCNLGDTTPPSSPKKPGG